MSGNLAGFNAAAVDLEAGDFSPLPPGDYLAIITKSEVKPNNKGDGMLLALTWEVVEGPKSGRLVFDNINLSNPSEKAASIGQRELAKLCLAVGIPTPNDSTDLHDKPVLIKVKVEEAKGAYKAKNGVDDYNPPGAGGYTAPALVASSAAPVEPWKQPSSAGAPPAFASVSTDDAAPWIR